VVLSDTIYTNYFLNCYGNGVVVLETIIGIRRFFEWHIPSISPCEYCGPVLFVNGCMLSWLYGLCIYIPVQLGKVDPGPRRHIKIVQIIDLINNAAWEFKPCVKIVQPLCIVIPQEKKGIRSLNVMVFYKLHKYITFCYL